METIIQTFEKSKKQITDAFLSLSEKEQNDQRENYDKMINTFNKGINEISNTIKNANNSTK